jgi:hypothetical protein
METMRTSNLEHARELSRQFDAIAQDAAKLVTGLDDPCGRWRVTPESWSVAQCLEHLAISNRVYLRPMQDAAREGQAPRRRRIGSAIPALLGHWFAKSLEPPAKALFKAKAPSAIRPSGASTVKEAFEDFMASHHQVTIFVSENADLDLDGVSFRNPFVRGLRFSVASGMHIIAAHDRRHLWQAWKNRRSAESAFSKESCNPRADEGSAVALRHSPPPAQPIVPSK